MAQLFDRQQADNDALLVQKGDRIAFERCGKYIELVYINIKAKDCFKAYSGDLSTKMRDEAILRMVQGIYKYNPAKCSLYSYLQMICRNAFTTMIKQWKNRNSLLFIEDISSEKLQNL